MKKFSALFLMLLISSFACCGYNSFITSKNQDTAIVGDTGTPSNSGTPSGPGNPGANSQTSKMTVTFYGFTDNDDGNGKFTTSVIAYPKKDGFPTHHNGTTEGAGTYNDPITFATGKKAIDDGTFPVGSIIYVPFLQKYFMLEDECASCKTDHVDLFLGRTHDPNEKRGGPTEQCENKLTPDGKVDIILKPSSSLPVDTTALFENGQCTGRIH